MIGWREILAASKSAAEVDGGAADHLQPRLRRPDRHLGGNFVLDPEPPASGAGDLPDAGDILLWVPRVRRAPLVVQRDELDRSELIWGTTPMPVSPGPDWQAWTCPAMTVQNVIQPDALLMTDRERGVDPTLPNRPGAAVAGV